MISQNEGIKQDRLRMNFLFTPSPSIPWAHCFILKSEHISSKRFYLHDTDVLPRTLVIGHGVVHFQVIGSDQDQPDSNEKLPLSDGCLMLFGLQEMS